MLADGVRAYKQQSQDGTLLCPYHVHRGSCTTLLSDGQQRMILAVDTIAEENTKTQCHNNGNITHNEA